MWKTTFSVAGMDCPSEEQLVRMQLESVTGITSIAFDLQQRTVEVVHSGSSDEIEARLEPLRLGSTLLASERVEGVAADGAAGEQRRLLLQVLAINFAFFLIEVVAGFAGGSMGLVADSLDMLADSIVYALSLSAIGRSAGHKARVAGVSGVFQLILAVAGFAEVLRRFVTPEGTPSFAAMIGVSFLALLGNATCLYLLQKGRSREAHMQASMIFTSNDVLANAGVIVAGVLVLLTRSKLPDLIVGFAIFALVARGALRILQIARQARRAT